MQHRRAPRAPTTRRLGLLPGQPSPHGRASCRPHESTEGGPDDRPASDVSTDRLCKVASSSGDVQLMGSPSSGAFARVLPAAAVASLFSRTLRTLANWERRGILVPLRIAGRRYHQEADVEALLVGVTDGTQSTLKQRFDEDE